MADSVEHLLTQREADDYSAAVGQRLRSVRRSRGLALQDVESQSGGEFKASVLGAYERGERAISVPRLHRLSQLYETVAADLLPETDAEASSSNPLDVMTGGSLRLMVDLVEVEQPTAGPTSGIRRYLTNLQVLDDQAPLGALGGVAEGEPDES